MENKSYLAILLTVLFALLFYFVFLDVPSLSPSTIPNYPGEIPSDGTGVGNPPDGTGVGNPPDGTGVGNPPDGLGIIPPNGSDIIPPPEPPVPGQEGYSCSSNIDCNEGLCCTSGGFQHDRCNPINNLHGGVCMGGGGGGGAATPGGNNYPCTANANCNEGLCCTTGGFLPNRCHPLDRLYGGICMLSPPEPTVNTPVIRPPEPPEIPPEEDNPFPLKYIILIVLGAILLIGAIIALVIYLRSKNKKLSRPGGVAPQQRGDRRMPPPNSGKISVLTGSEDPRKRVVRRFNPRNYPGRRLNNFSFL